MKRNKILLCGLFTGLTLCLGACGQNDTANDNNMVTEEPIPAKEDVASVDNETTENSSAAGSGKAEDDLLAENGDNADNSDNTKTNTSITLTFTEDTETVTAEDGTELYTNICNYPTVEIDGNPEAAELINADIMERVDAFKNSSEIQRAAKEDYELYPEYFNSYGDWLFIGAPRADTDVISLVMEYESYSGGAHGNLVNVAVNYDPNTGDILSFSDLSDNVAQFRINTLEYNQKTAATEEYAESLFTTDSITNGELENVLYAEDKWYFSDEGLVFISDPYMLGPWAAGTIEFTIPYEELVGLGMKEIYNQPGPRPKIINLNKNDQPDSEEP